VALALSTGDGVPPNKAAAVAWLHKAAEQGQVDAQYDLGLAYRNGDGVSVDEAAGVEWTRTAAEQGHERALRMPL
jgi:TPR repeat protein